MRKKNFFQFGCFKPLTKKDKNFQSLKKNLCNNGMWYNQIGFTSTGIYKILRSSNRFLLFLFLKNQSIHLADH